MEVVRSLVASLVMRTVSSCFEGGVLCDHAKKVVVRRGREVTGKFVHVSR